MHIDNNLDYENPIIDQLDDLGVAVNKMNPKEDDFTYKYSELNREHKDVIFGMAYMCDSLANFDGIRTFESKHKDETPTLNKMRDEIEGNALNDAFNFMIDEMCEALICFADDEAQFED